MTTASQIATARTELDLAKLKTRTAERAYNEALNRQSLLAHKLDDLIFNKQMDEWVEKEAK